MMNLKNTVSAWLAVLLFSAGVSANALTLADVMQSMAATVKSINSQATNPAQNANSADLALRLANLCDSAKSFTPSTATSADQKATYDQLMSTAAQTARDLAKAFQAGDNSKAVQLLQQLAAQKKNGHAQFN